MASRRLRWARCEAATRASASAGLPTTVSSRWPTTATSFVPGDRVVVLGPEATVATFCRDVGERSDQHLPLDRSALDFRRVVVSNRRLAGQPVGDLDLGPRFGSTVTRVRRGDDDLVADEDFELQLGDRVRVVGPVDQLGKVARYLGDSERRLAEVDACGFALGIAAGLALGAVTFPLPGGVDIELGAGGGPLVIGLVLGVVSRTGPVTWQIPHGANLVLRQLGILMFLASAGLASGTTFADTIGTGTAPSSPSPAPSSPSGSPRSSRSPPR